MDSVYLKNKGSSSNLFTFHCMPFLLMQIPICKLLGVTQNLILQTYNWNAYNMKYSSLTRFYLVWPFPSYSRKATLFGHIVSKIPEAWQSVSTISRSKLRLHKHSPNPTKTIWACRGHLQHLTIQKWMDLNRWIFLNRPYNFGLWFSKAITLKWIVFTWKTKVPLQTCSHFIVCHFY
jgi:hypothetical protein